MSDQLLELKSLLEQVARDKTRIEMQRDQAGAELKQKVQELKSEFGVSNLTEANDLLTDIESKLDTEVSYVRDQLDQAKKKLSNAD